MLSRTILSLHVNEHYVSLYGYTAAVPNASFKSPSR